MSLSVCVRVLKVDLGLVEFCCYESLPKNTAFGSVLHDSAASVFEFIYVDPPLREVETTSHLLDKFVRD